MRQFKVNGILSLHRYPDSQEKNGRKHIPKTIRQREERSKHRGRGGGKKTIQQKLVVEVSDSGIFLRIGVEGQQVLHMQLVQVHFRLWRPEQRRIPCMFANSACPWQAGCFIELRHHARARFLSPLLQISSLSLSLSPLCLSLSPLARRAPTASSLLERNTKLSIACHLLLNRKRILSIYTPVLLDEKSSNYLWILGRGIIREGTSQGTKSPSSGRKRTWIPTPGLSWPAAQAFLP